MVELGKELKRKRVGVDLIKYNILMSEIPKQLKQTNKQNSTNNHHTGDRDRHSPGHVTLFFVSGISGDHVFCSMAVGEVTSCLKAGNNSLLGYSC